MLASSSPSPIRGGRRRVALAACKRQRRRARAASEYVGIESVPPMRRPFPGSFGLPRGAPIPTLENLSLPSLNVPTCPYIIPRITFFVKTQFYRFKVKSPFLQIRILPSPAKTCDKKSPYRRLFGGSSLTDWSLTLHRLHCTTMHTRDPCTAGDPMR